jgi:hypothetical protein
VDLEWGPLSLVGKIEELVEKERRGSGLEIREYIHRGPSQWPCGTSLSEKVNTNIADKQR